MAIPRPRICTRVTIPTGGWAFQADISDGVQYNTAIDVTLSAGDYFVSGDGQSDDLLFELATQIAGDGNWPGADAYFGVTVNPSTLKTHMIFCGDFFEGVPGRSVRIDWPNCAAGLASALGFDNAAADTSTISDHPTFTGDYETAYNWWANDDGQLINLNVENQSLVNAIQATALDGTTKTQEIGSRHTAMLQLHYLDRDQTFSQRVGYGTAPVYPYERNRGLECWWEEVKGGTEFRVYRDQYIATARAAEQGSWTAQDTTTMTDAGKAWDTEPQEWDNAVLYIPDWGENSAKRTIPMYYFINASTATVLTVANAHPSGLDVGGSGSAGVYYLFHHRYDTYVVDSGQMKSFQPGDHDSLDHYNIAIPLKRYVA
jgi:hypothetical protein